MYINGVFEGGGIKGIAYIGAIRFLEERGFQFRGVGGASVGSLFSALLAAKYTSKDMERIIKDFDANILTYSKSKKPIQKFINGIKHKGLYSMKFFENYLNELLVAKNCSKFMDVKVGEDYLLKIVVTDLKNKREIIIPNDLGLYNYSKDAFSIAMAVTMSCSMPVVFVPYRIGKNIFMDGGVVNNFPINLFSNSNIPTLGFKLNEYKSEKNLINRYKDKIFKSNIEYKLDSYNIVDIDTSDYKVTDFKKGLENYKDLIKLGYNSMRDYFYRKY